MQLTLPDIVKLLLHGSYSRCPTKRYSSSYFKESEGEVRNDPAPLQPDHQLSQVGHNQQARLGFHTSRLFRDRVPESPFQDRSSTLGLPEGLGSGDSEEPFLKISSASLPKIVIISPENKECCKENNFFNSGSKKRALHLTDKTRSMEEKSASNFNQAKMKRNSSMGQLMTLVHDSIDEMVKVAEVTKPVIIMKAAMGTVTFKREDNIKKEMDRNVKKGKYFKEDLSLEHYNRLKVTMN